MTRSQTMQERPLTLAEICQAIEKGAVAADVEEGFYTVRLRDLVRLARQPELRTQPQRRQSLPLAS